MSQKEIFKLDPAKAVVSVGEVKVGESLLEVWRYGDCTLFTCLIETIVLPTTAQGRPEIHGRLCASSGDGR